MNDPARLLPERTETLRIEEIDAAIHSTRECTAPFMNRTLSLERASPARRWQRSLGVVLPGSAAALAAIVAHIDRRSAAQLADPGAWGVFIAGLFMVAVTLLAFGRHHVWRLRPEIAQNRRIGRYELLSPLGAGGCSDVWAAFDTELERRVALKMVSRHRHGARALARVQLEVRALAKLTHPNTVRVLDSGATHDGLSYYAMELLNGQTLRQLVANEGPLSLDRLSHIAQQLLCALGEAHDKGIIHRDIKPENVFVVRAAGAIDVVKLLDFGIAASSADTQLTSTGLVTGTPAYMPPETIIGQPADVRSDIYSFGATLYFSLTGRLPFEDDSSLDLLAAHVYRPLTPMSLATSAPIPLALERVVRRCMAKDPAERYPSTRAVSTALCRSVVHAPLVERAPLSELPSALRTLTRRSAEMS